MILGILITQITCHKCYWSRLRLLRTGQLCTVLLSSYGRSWGFWGGYIALQHTPTHAWSAPNLPRHPPSPWGIPALFTWNSIHLSTYDSCLITATRSVRIVVTKLHNHMSHLMPTSLNNWDSYLSSHKLTICTILYYIVLYAIISSRGKKLNGGQLFQLLFFSVNLNWRWLSLLVNIE